MSDHSPVVVSKGLGSSEPAPPGLSAVRGRPVLIVATAIAFIGMVLLGTEPPSPPVSGTLESPGETGAGISADQPVVTGTTLPEIATGWNRLDLPGKGTVVGLAHGGSGWMAVSDGDPSTVATSPDGRVWVTHTFPGSLHGEVELLVTDTQLVVVDTDLARSAGARSWISSDGGVTWTTGLFTNGFARVDALTSADTRLLAAGATAIAGADLVDETGAITAAVWEYTAEGWVPVGFPTAPGPHSAISELVELDGQVIAFGRADGRAAAWRLDGRSVVSEEVSLPRQAEGGAFRTVTRSWDDSWVAELKVGSGVVYARSTDLRSWSLLAMGLEDGGTSSAASTRLGVVYVGEGDQTYRTAERWSVQEVNYRYPDTATGFDPERHTAVVASDGNLIVMGGGTHSPALWLRGLVGGRVGVVARPPETGRWQLRQTFGSGYWGQDPQPLSVVASDGELVIATPQGVWSTPAAGTTEPTSHGITAHSLFGTSQGLFLTDSSSKLFRMEDDGWVPEDLDLSVGGMSSTGTSLVVLGWNGAGESMLATQDGGEWQVEHPGSSPAVYPIASTGGLILGFEAGRAPDNGGRMSPDGVNWAPIDIGGLRGLESGAPFFVVDRYSGSTRIEFLDDSLSIEVPSVDPVEAVRVGDIVRVRGTDGLWETRDDGGSWVSYPIGIEYRLTGPIRLVPHEDPMLLLAARDSYRLLTFESDPAS